MSNFLHTFVVAIGAGLVLLPLPLSPVSSLVRTQKQETGAAARTEPPLTVDATQRSDASLVSVNVLVTDDDGRVLPGLKPCNFRILDNGRPQKLVDFAPASAPITIVVLMEYSAASYSYFAGRSADWGAAFLRHLEPRDWVALTTFDLQPKVQVDFTHKQDEVRDAIAWLGPPRFQEVNLYDALADTLEKLNGVRGRKSILLLATGLDTFSATTLEEMYGKLRQTDVTIFSIGLAEAEYTRYGSGVSYLQSKNSLATFAKMTGGLALFPRFQGEMPTIFRSVVGYLRSEYTLTFRPPPELRDGRYHRLQMEIVGPDGKPLTVTDEKGNNHKIDVFTRQGYTAQLNKPQ